MPLYDYTCRQCDHQFDVLVYADEDEPKGCPDCGSKKVERGFSVPGLPQVKATPAAGACQSNGPPCGSHCRRS